MGVGTSHSIEQRPTEEGREDGGIIYESGFRVDAAVPCVHCPCRVEEQAAAVGHVLAIAYGATKDRDGRSDETGGKPGDDTWADDDGVRESANTDSHERSERRDGSGQDRVGG